MIELAEKLAETLSVIVKELAGKGSDLVLTLEDVTIDIGGKPIKISGKITLNVVYVRETE